MELLVDYGINYHKYGKKRLQIELDKSPYDEHDYYPEIVDYLKKLLKNSGS